MWAFRILSIVVLIMSCTVTMAIGATQSAPKISAVPSSVNLGKTKVGGTSPSKTISIKNTGSSSLILDTISITGENASDFHQSGNCGTILQGESCTLEVFFTPTMPFSSKTAALVIPSNDPKKPLVNVKLSGTAPPPAIKASGSLNFGKIVEGSAILTKSVVIGNSGVSDLSIDWINVSGANQSEFLLASNCNTVQAGSSCSINITFSPKAPVGKKSALLEIASNDPKKPLINLKLAGDAPDTVKPEQPYNLSLSSADHSNTISWDSVGNATKYELLWDTENFDSTVAKRVKNVTSPYVHSGLTNGTEYYYAIVASNWVGTSNESNLVHGIPTNGDYISPYIKSIYPPNGSTNIPLDADIKVTFSEPVNYTGSNPSLSFFKDGVLGSYITAKDITWNNDKTVLKYASTANTPNKTVASVLSQNILDGNNNKLNLSWSDAVVVSSDPATPYFSPTTFTYADKYTYSKNLDYSFGTNGIVQLDIMNGDNLTSVIQQSDGKLLLGGSTNGGKSLVVVRLLTDGSLDTDFGSGGKYIYSYSGSDSVNALALQTDGKIILAGNIIQRLHTNGTLDSSFASYGTFQPPFPVNKMRILNDGKVLIAGISNKGSALARFNSDMTTDVSFGTNGITTIQKKPYDYEVMVGLDIDAVGNIYICSQGYDNTISMFLQYYYYVIARFGSNGQLDTGYGTGGFIRPTMENLAATYANFVNLYPLSMTVSPAGNVYLAGTMRKNEPDPSGLPGSIEVSHMAVLEYVPGYAKPNYRFGDYDFDATAYGILMENTGDVVIASNDDAKFGLRRYTSVFTGGSYYSITTKAVITNDGYANMAGILKQSDGKILLYGNVTTTGASSDFTLLRYPVTIVAP